MAQTIEENSLKRFKLHLSQLHSIDAHRGGGDAGAPHLPPQKTLTNCNIKNAIKHETRGPPSQIFSLPHVPPQKNLKMTVHLRFRLTVRWS
jgi:hypothetical protein